MAHIRRNRPNNDVIDHFFKSSHLFTSHSADPCVPIPIPTAQHLIKLFQLLVPLFSLYANALHTLPTYYILWSTYSTHTHCMLYAIHERVRKHPRCASFILHTVLLQMKHIKVACTGCIIKTVKYNIYAYLLKIYQSHGHWPNLFLFFSLSACSCCFNCHSLYLNASK